MEEEIKNIKLSFDKDLKNTKDVESLEGVRIRYLGRKGLVSGLLGRLSSLDEKTRPRIGKELNLLKTYVQNEFQNRKKILSVSEPGRERVDVTMPGILPQLGHLHPITKTLSEINEIFVSLGLPAGRG